jgi:hypothetical protein
MQQGPPCGGLQSSADRQICVCRRRSPTNDDQDRSYSENLVHTLGVDQTLTIEQAFQAMRCFVDQFMKREPEQYRARFEQIIRWTRVEGDGITYDPAQWEDWKASVARALGPESNLP